MESQQLQKLISDLLNGNVQQRRAASYKLSKFKDIEAVPALIQAYNDMDDSVRRNVIEGLNNIGSRDALDFLSQQGVPLAVRDPFLMKRSRATMAGALGGLAGVEVGLLAGGFFMSSLVDPGYIYLTIAFVCVYPYALLGVAAGALIGRLSVKRDDDPENDKAVFRHGIINSGIAGLAIGILLYVFLWVYNYLWY